MESRMVPNLTQQLIDEFHGDTLGRIAGAIGETPAKTGNALRAAVPAVLAVLARKISHPNGAEEVLDIIHTQKLDGRWQRVENGVPQTQVRLSGLEWMVWAMMTEPITIADIARRLCAPDLETIGAIKRLRSLNLIDETD